jgi:hypothetical protein
MGIQMRDCSLSGLVIEKTNTVDSLKLALASSERVTGTWKANVYDI